MDPQAAKEYHALLWNRVSKRESLVERAWWIPALAICGFFAFDSFAGSVFGLLVGWGVTSIHVRIDDLARKPWEVEMMRHLHEHSDEAEAGKQMYEIQASVEKVSRKWWGGK